MHRLLVNGGTSALKAACNSSPTKTKASVLLRSLSSSTPVLSGAKSSGDGAVNQRPLSTAAEPFLNGSSSAYVEEMYNAWLANPQSVHAVSKAGEVIL